MRAPMTPLRWLLLALGFLWLAAPAPASAQFGRIKDMVKKKGEDKVVEKATEATTSASGAAPADAAAEKPAGEEAGPASADAASPAGDSGGKGTAAAEPKLWVNYDFVPGDRVSCVIVPVAISILQTCL